MDRCGRFAADVSQVRQAPSPRAYTLTPHARPQRRANPIVTRLPPALFNRLRRSGVLGLWVVALLLAPVRAATLDYDEYMQRAKAAKSRGDWQSVASQLAQAINHPDQPKGETERALLLLEYGRAIGVLCQFGEAEKYLLRSKVMVEKAGSSPFVALYELGAINVAQQKFAEAAGYFSQFALIAERESRATTSPQLLADGYEKFSIALAATGQTDEAQARRREALGLRETSPKAAPAGSITPYGLKCPKS